MTTHYEPNATIEIRQDSDKGRAWVLYLRDGDEVTSVAGPMEFEGHTASMFWGALVAALDEDDWTNDTQIVEWANGHDWQRTLYVDEEPGGGAR